MTAQNLHHLDGRDPETVDLAERGVISRQSGVRGRKGAARGGEFLRARNRAQCRLWQLTQSLLASDTSKRGQERAEFRLLLSGSFATWATPHNIIAQRIPNKRTTYEFDRVRDEKVRGLWQ